MRRLKLGTGLLAFCLIFSTALVAAPNTPTPPDKKADSESEKPESKKFEPFKPEAVTSNGTVTVDGHAIPYQAIAGTLVVHPKGWDDVPRDPKDEGDHQTAEASMFYVAYFKSGGGNRPITFIYNGGPGSASFWLHLGAFGPRHIVTSTDAHTPAAPYSLINNGSSLLDVSDLVFIDAPGTGFSRIAGKDKEKASSASTPTLTHSPNSSPSFCRNTAAGTRPNTCSVRATAHPARPC